jgi:hypothetical protein
MRRGKIITVLAAAMAAILPLKAGLITPLDSTNPTPTDAGTFVGGTVLNITITGAISLDGPEGFYTNPDGSLSVTLNQTPDQCPACYAPGYEYFIQGNPYPDGHGGMTYTNTFQGGGSNYDMYPGGGGNPANFAPYGNQAIDPSAPNIIRFGAVAYVFVPDMGITTMSGLQPSDWQLLGTPNGSGGYGGTFVVPGSGLEHLMVVVSDTYYPNDVGTYMIDATPMPEPAAIGLVFGGLIVLGTVEARRRTRRA